MTVSYVMMLHCLAIEAAVTGWSPVTITTLIPADLHFSTANGTESLGGSERERTPTKVWLLKSKFSFSVLNLYPNGNLSFGKWYLANPRTLSPFLPKLLFALSNLASKSAVFGTGFPLTSIFVQSFHILYGAPLVNMQ